MCRGISPWGTASGDSCSFKTWKSTHLHLSGIIKKGSTGQGGRPACSLQRKHHTFNAFNLIMYKRTVCQEKYPIILCFQKRLEMQITVYNYTAFIQVNPFK